MEKKIIWGTLAGGLTYFLLGWVIYGMLMMSFFNGEMLLPGVYKEIPDFPFLILGNLISAYLLTHILSRWTNATSAGDGAKTGLFFGLVLGLGYNMTMYGVANLMTLKGAIVDAIVSGVMTAIVGAVIAAVVSSGKKQAA